MILARKTQVISLIRADHVVSGAGELTRLGLRRGVSRGAQQAERREQQDLQVEPQRLMLQVMQIEAQTLADVATPTQSMDLRPAGDPRLHLQALFVARILAAEALRKRRPLRPRTHQTHVAAQDVPKLRQLVEA